MEIYRFAFIILLSSLLVSCGEKKQETGNADKAAEKKTPAFTLPEAISRLYPSLLAQR